VYAARLGHAGERARWATLRGSFGFLTPSPLWGEGRVRGSRVRGSRVRGSRVRGSRVRGSRVRGRSALPHRLPQHGQQLALRNSGDASGLRHRHPWPHHPAKQPIPELLEVRMVAREHLDQLRVLVEQPGDRDVARDHAGVLRGSFSAASSASKETPAAAAASVTVRWAPQQ
jgi:hypothetical protein